MSESNAIISLSDEYHQFKKDGLYQSHNAGDTNTFRYPHLSQLAGNFDFDGVSWILRREVESTLNAIAINDLTLYELMNPHAKKLHLNDFLGYQSAEKEKRRAYNSVVVDYNENNRRGTWKQSSDFTCIRLSDYPIHQDFSHLRDLLQLLPDHQQIYVYKFRNLPAFQFGSMLKGTNIIFVDDNPSTIGQELFHALFHLAEGVRGFKDDNLNIRETWANVPQLYLLQLACGRMERRKRTNVSPHTIKFLDYVFLRAYIGQGFIPIGTSYCYHSIYALIEPIVRLLFESLKGISENEKNAFLIDSIFFDKVQPVVECFDRTYGGSTFSRVYSTMNLFGRLKILEELCPDVFPEILRKMFAGRQLLPTALDSKLVALIWLCPELQAEKDIIIDLIEDFSNSKIWKTGQIDIETWYSHIQTAFGMRETMLVESLITSHITEIHNIFGIE